MAQKAPPLEPSSALPQAHTLGCWLCTAPHCTKFSSHSLYAGLHGYQAYCSLCRVKALAQHVCQHCCNLQEHDLITRVQLAVNCFEVCTVYHRDLDKQEAEIKEKLKQEKKREERKNREAFSDLLREDLDEGFIKPKMRWRVCQSPTSLDSCMLPWWSATQKTFPAQSPLSKVESTYV